MFGWTAHPVASWLLAFFFVGVGTLKAFFADDTFRAKFVNYATVFPLNGMTPWTTPQVDAIVLMRGVGLAEIAVGVLFTGLAGANLQRLAAGAQVLIMAGACWVHVAMEEYNDMAVPWILCMICAARFVLLPDAPAKTNVD